MKLAPSHKDYSRKVILDSNALFVPLQFKIDISEGLRDLLKTPFEPIIPSPVLKELETIARTGSPKMKKKASFALKLAEKYRIIEIIAETSTDDVIVKMASKWNCPVFTNDKRLKEKLRDINVPVIYVRQKTLLKMEGSISILV
jgi:uncharacterized protein